MTCLFCKGDIVKSTTNYVVSLKSRIIIVKNVPCEECKQCGETYFDDVVMEQLEQIVTAHSTAITEVAIINYPYRVA